MSQPSLTDAQERYLALEDPEMENRITYVFAMMTPLVVMALRDLLEGKPDLAAIICDLDFGLDGLDSRLANSFQTQYLLSEYFPQDEAVLKFRYEHQEDLHTLKAYYSISFLAKPAITVSIKYDERTVDVETLGGFCLYETKWEELTLAFNKLIEDMSGVLGQSR